MQTAGLHPRNLHLGGGQGLGVCVSSTFSGAVDAAGPGHLLWEPAPCTPPTPRSRAGVPGWGSVGSVVQPSCAPVGVGFWGGLLAFALEPFFTEII